MKTFLFSLILSLSLTLYAQRHVPGSTQVKISSRHGQTPIPTGKRAKFFGPSKTVLPSAETVYYFENFDNGIPSSWTVSDSAGYGIAWQGVSYVLNEYSNRLSLDGTPFAAVDSYNAGEIYTDTYLESPVIPVNNNGNPVYLSFNHFFRYFSGEYDEKGDVEVYDGSQWVLLARYENQDYGSLAPLIRAVYDITPYINPSFKIRFHYYNALWEWYWMLDNIKIYTPPANDLSLEWAIPYVMITGENAYFSTLVINNGYNTQNTFTVRVNVYNDADVLLHTESVNFQNAALSLADTLKVRFSETWIPPADGNYRVEYTLTLPGDENPSNNVFTIAAPSKIFRYEPGKIYTFIAYDGDNSGDKNLFGYFDTDGTFTAIDSINGLLGHFFSSGAFNGYGDVPVLVAVDNEQIFYFIDGDGTAYPYGYTPFFKTLFDGLTFTPEEEITCTANRLYKISPYLDIIYKSVLSINVVYPIFISITSNGANKLYGAELINNMLYSVDPQDFSVTEIGHLGYNINYAQDIDFDKENNILYGTLYYVADNAEFGGLFTIDTISGQASLISSLTGNEYSLCAVAPSNVMKTREEEVFQWKIYPNPAETVLHVHWKNRPDFWQIIDAAGKILMEGKAEKETQSIDVSSLSPGTYRLKIQKGDNTAVKVFLKR